MKQAIRFKRNVYIIILFILALAALIQLSRSEFILKFSQKEQAVERYKDLIAQVSGETVKPLTSGNYCIAYKSTDDQSMKLRDNTIRTLAYMKRQAVSFDLAAQKLDYGGCSVVLIATGDLDALRNGSRLEDYVYGGGAVFFMQMPENGDYFKQLYRKLGILSFDDGQLTSGIHLTSNVLIGEKGLKTGEDFLIHVSSPVEIDKESELLAQSIEGIPLIWKRRYGEGVFAVYNGNVLHQKGNRGLITGVISLLKNDFLYPIFNSKVFYIDDFPAPIRKGLDASLYKQYGLDIPGFFQNIWWPDMLKAASRHHIKYTAAVIQSYQDNVVPPFHDPEDEERHQLIAYGREVIKSGGEVAIHGFNHQSLQMDADNAGYFGYKVWPGTREMELSIREVLSYVETAFPNYKAMSYVPPSNVLSKEGREALKAAWPNLAVIASLYDTDYSGRAYVQEYGLAEDGIIEMPRITSGYFESPYTRWLEANAITSLGFFSHFLHPDDLLDETRSRNQTWAQLYEDFSAMLERLDHTYPWLRSMTSTEAGFDMVASLYSDVSIEQTADEIAGTAERYVSPLYFILRSERKIAKQSGCTVNKIDEDTYLVTVHGPRFSIGLGG
ncbi:DUF2194 domain-containing protein [Paenibacillus thermoaerophilus]|uniref:DUF2194 domain-containing protein n=1 Tax=Paenibacillus thermoaerophilus TaxID=1215385 RepID=A0ABW2V6L5_9BACL|nr:DUF2194 domain-containing protein [Paenibacillus thermoaerophilus]TMV11160.1 DUF2194 domain-containing protein [Paenibacillus thermoaerophilus]